MNLLIEKIQNNRTNQEVLSQLLPIVQSSFIPTKYEQILMTRLRDHQTTTEKFRIYSDKLANLLVNKVIECLPTRKIDIRTPLPSTQGQTLATTVELVSIMRSGDALLDTFIKHFPESNISKFLIQRDEVTALPHFKYMKLSHELISGSSVVITEPMIATGGSLDMVISILLEKGVKEENIVIASVCGAPEGLIHLNSKFPKIKVVLTMLDERLNEQKYIVPGLGDFGDRFFGTPDH